MFFNIGAQKIDGTMLDIYKIIVAAFLITEKTNQIRFVKETFLMANFSPKRVFEIPFIILSSPTIDFLG